MKNRKQNSFSEFFTFEHESKLERYLEHSMIVWSGRLYIVHTRSDRLFFATVLHSAPQ